MNVFDDIKNNIAIGDVSGAISLLEPLAPQYANDLLLILSQFNSVKKDFLLTLIQKEDYYISTNKIKLAVIEILEQTMQKQPAPVMFSDTNESAIDFENYREWNTPSTFFVLEKIVDLDFSACVDRMDGNASPTIVEDISQIIERKNESQDYFIIPASSDKQYPVFETVPKPDKVIKLDPLAAIPDAQKKYQSVAFFNVKKYSDNNTFSIRQKQYLPAGICEEKNHSVSIGSQYACKEFVINLYFSTKSCPKEIRYFEIPEFSFSHQSTGVSYNRFTYETPQITTSVKGTLYCLTWKIPSPKDGHIYTISWNME